MPGAASSSRSLLDCLVAAPYDCSGRFVGCERMPAALRAAGLQAALGLEDLGNLQVVIADDRRDPTWGVVGLDDLVAASTVIRDAVGSLVGSGRKPLLLGGDCTVLLGAMAGLQATHPEAGLAFIDGHLDCYDGASSESGEGADMELALLLGVGARPLVDIGRRRPLIDDHRVICIGPVDEHEAAALGAPDPRAFAPRMTIVDGAQVARDPEACGVEATARLTRDGGSFWLHLDLDVLHRRALPAVDYPQDDGLDWEQLELLLVPLLRSPGLIGMDLTIYNPTLDGDGRHARRIVDVLARAAGVGNET